MLAWADSPTYLPFGRCCIQFLCASLICGLVGVCVCTKVVKDAWALSKERRAACDSGLPWEASWTSKRRYLAVAARLDHSVELWHVASYV